MKLGDALNELAVPACLLLNRRARRAMLALVTLRRAYEYLLVMAALEGARDAPRPYYEAYVDAMEILGARALLVARAL
jgi:hypothetical protein